MATVHFTSVLKRFYPDIETCQIDADTIGTLVQALNTNYPGLSDYLIMENGELRKHVNIFLNGSMIRDRKTLSDQVTADCTVHIIQALSGG